MVWGILGMTEIGGCVSDEIYTEQWVNETSASVGELPAGWNMRRLLQAASIKAGFAPTRGRGYELSPLDLVALYDALIAEGIGGIGIRSSMASNGISAYDTFTTVSAISAQGHLWGATGKTNRVRMEDKATSQVLRALRKKGDNGVCIAWLEGEAARGEQMPSFHETLEFMQECVCEEKILAEACVLDGLTSPAPTPRARLRGKGRL